MDLWTVYFPKRNEFYQPSAAFSVPFGRPVTAVSLWGPMWMVAVLNAGKMKLIERSIVA